MEKIKNMASAETISVIVPVYKVEEYLSACIDSILGQTHRDFQLILVDDGSPDRCGEICEEYAAKDSRIVVIHQENGGLSAARNAGIDWVFANSESQWLNFIDSDDLVSPVYLETLYKYAVENDADITVTGGDFFADEQELEKASDKVISVRNATGRECCVELMSDDNFFLNIAWGKLFRRKVFEGLRYPVGRIHEDEALAPILMYRARRVTIVRSWLYWYRQRESSIVHSVFSEKNFDLVWACSNYISYFLARDERTLAAMAKKRRNKFWAECILRARKEGASVQIPAEYRMPLWKAYYFTLADTLRRGGVKFVLERLGNLARKIIKKR